MQKSILRPCKQSVAVRAFMQATWFGMDLQGATMDDSTKQFLKYVLD